MRVRLLNLFDLRPLDTSNKPKMQIPLFWGTSCSYSNQPNISMYSVEASYCNILPCIMQLLTASSVTNSCLQTDSQMLFFFYALTILYYRILVLNKVFLSQGPSGLLAWLTLCAKESSLSEKLCLLSVWGCVENYKWINWLISWAASSGLG